MEAPSQSYWSISSSEVLKSLQTTPAGLTTDEAHIRFDRNKSNTIQGKKRSGVLTLLIAQFKSPIMLILLFAAGLSIYVHGNTDAIIILTIVLISGLLGFWQEKGAADAVAKLLALVRVNVTALRDGNSTQVPLAEIVPGDVIILSAGAGIPGDCLLLESADLYVDEATLTGETYPIEKTPVIQAAELPLAKRVNSLFMGTHVVSGTGKAVVVKTGSATEFGKISESLKVSAPETQFENGVRRFGYFLMEVTLVLVIVIFAINVYLARPVLDSFLFSLALAVGLTPQLLPAIISINLASGAKRMASAKVIVKRLSSIENFGSMNVLCSDKTGTLTEGAVHIRSTLNLDGAESEKVLLYAYLNAFFEAGFTNPIDTAIRSFREFKTDTYRKVGEVPYDFLRKRLSVLLSKDGQYLMITKGAFQNIITACATVETSDGTVVPLVEAKEKIEQQFAELSQQGYRTLGIAYRTFAANQKLSQADETEMVFLGFIVLFDPLKPGIVETIQHLKLLGVTLKVITGDNQLVANNLSKQLGFASQRVVTGADLHQMSDEALAGQVNEIAVFAEIEPNQKERIILALHKAGNVTGYIGDGINDASALHAADVSISVESAVDVAKDAADIVLLQKDLNVLIKGVQEGRVTFANTLKYVFMATSANFGNMFSMAGVSLFLPFLPLLPKQILLTNLLTDFPEMTIATDRVDPELVNKPRRWDIGFIRKFMLTFGLLSSVFDFLTFFVLQYVLHTNIMQFRTGWYLESVISASLIVLVIRSRKPFFSSMPSNYLAGATLAVIAVTLLLPFTPLSRVLGFSPVPLNVMFFLALIVAAYITAAELMKKVFYKMVDPQR